MIHLLEKEFGFDAEAMGFPSISGCHAVVYHTEEGFFGFHNAGGSKTTDFEPRAKWLAEFAKDNFVKAGKGLHLYGVCSRGTANNRGYDMGAGLKCWKDEMKAYAKALGYKGPVSGYDLDKQRNWPKNPNSEIGVSAYVDFKKTNAGVTIGVKPWPDCNSTSGACTNRANHKSVDLKTNKIVPISKNVTLTVTPKSALIAIAATDYDAFRI